MSYLVVKKYYVIPLCIVALTIYFFQAFGLILPEMINNYSNDFLLIPIVLNLCKTIIQFVKSKYNLQLPLLFCITVTTGYSFFFEVWLPTINPRYTADIWDVFTYFLGLIFYLKIENYNIVTRLFISFKHNQ